MTDREQTQPEPDETREDADDQGGVFGNLPGTRPGSAQPPARQSSLAPGERAEAERSPERPGRSPVRRGRPTPPRDTGAGDPAGQQATQHGGVEDLAWAGVAVAAEAATLGVRLLSRAVEAVRKPADRR